MKCPNCRKQATIEHFRESEACRDAAATLCGILARSRRDPSKDNAGGRPKGAKDKQPRKSRIEPAV